MKKNIIMFALLQISIFANAQVLDWATKIGASSGTKITVDDLGNSYVVGYYTGSRDFDLSDEETILESNGYRDVYIEKLDPNGDFVWAKSIGGTGDDIVYDITLDESNNIYVLGQFSETADFDPGIDEENLTAEGVTDIFIVKLDNDGNLDWAERIGNDNEYYADETGATIISDLNGNIYIYGTYKGTVDFNPGPGEFFQTADFISTDVFILKLTDDGFFDWVKSIGGGGYDMAGDLAIDNDNNLYFTGRFASFVDFDPNAGVEEHEAVALQDIFIEKLDDEGNFIWVKTFGGVDYDYGFSIALDSENNVYSTGIFAQEVDFDPSAGVDNVTAHDQWDMYVQKLDTDGNYQWTRTFGTDYTQYSTDIAADPMGGVYWLGYYGNGETIDFDPSVDELNKTSVSSRDMFMHKMDTDGNFEWMQLMGNEGFQQANSIFVVDNFEVYCTGSFQFTVDFDPTDGEYNLSDGGGFVQKLKLDNVGITTFENNQLINIYPNPSNGVFTIDIPNLDKKIAVSIFNNTGKLVYQSTEISNSTPFELETISNGIYFVKITLDSGEIISKKLIINK